MPSDDDLGELVRLSSVNFENLFRVVCPFRLTLARPASRRRFPRLVAHAQLEMEIFVMPALWKDNAWNKSIARQREFEAS